MSLDVSTQSTTDGRFLLILSAILNQSHGVMERLLKMMVARKKLEVNMSNFVQYMA